MVFVGYQYPAGHHSAGSGLPGSRYSYRHGVQLEAHPHGDGLCALHHVCWHDQCQDIQWRQAEQNQPTGAVRKGGLCKLRISLLENMGKGPKGARYLDYCCTLIVGILGNGQN